MRRDAQTRREALITAAAEAFEEEGYGVALEEVAARAGVGRGTLYRNFRDREALAFAIFEREVDRLGDLLAPGLGLRESLEILVRAAARSNALFSRIGAQLASDAESVAALEELGGRLIDMLEPLAAEAEARGELRTGIGGRGLSLAIRMLGGLYRSGDVAKGDRDIDLALDLVLGGIAPGAPRPL